MDLFAYAVSGIVVGVLVGITGVGGGAVMTPVLVLLFNVSAPLAIGTDLMFAAITKCFGVVVHHRRHRSVDWGIVARLSIGSIPGAVCALLLIKSLSLGGYDLNSVMHAPLGIALVLTGCALVVLPRIKSGAFCQQSCSDQEGALRVGLTVGMGFVLGILVTLSSVGAGALGATALLLLYPGLRTVKIVGTDLAYATPLATIAALGHWYVGCVDFLLLGGLLLGSIPGIWLGSFCSGRIPERILQPSLGILLTATGLKFLFR